MERILSAAYVFIAAALVSACSGGTPAESTLQTTETAASYEQTAPASYPASEGITETAAAEETETAAAEPEIASVLNGKIICVDAGHGITSDTSTELESPNSTKMKAKYASGTTGSTLTEEQLNLAVCLKLQAELEKRGAVVVMTRTQHDINGIDLGNVRRAQIGNEANADAVIHVHADGAVESAHGVSILVPYGSQLATQAIVEPSARLGQAVLTGFVNATGAYNRGLVQRTDLTGLNWSQVPTIFIEMGFMTNPQEDALMSTEDYQNKMVAGMVSGFEAYFS